MSLVDRDTGGECWGIIHLVRMQNVPEKLTLHSPRYARQRVRNTSFSESFAYVLNV